MNRRTPTKYDELLLLEEVDSICPVCGISLINKQAKKKKQFEIAHIYPNSPTKEEAKELMGVERLGSNSEDIQNWIALCSKCHTEYDFHKTKDECVEKELLEKIKDVIKTTEPQKLSLNRFVQLQNEINSLIRGKDVYNLRNKYKEEKANATKLYEEILQDSLTEVQQLLNNEINRRNDDVFNGIVKSPLITLRPKSYKYSCSDDNGTGSNYKNLILFDLSVLSLTCLPTLIHDTVLFKNIAVDVLEKLILQYNSFASKQIFISFDNLSNFSERTSEVLRDSKVLELIPGGNELYGFSWNKKM